MHTVSAREIEHFAKDSAHWWDENGPFRPLHRMNPVRMSFIREVVCRHFGRDERSLKALAGLSALDIGCGGGLVCEPMARMGADVTGIDADENAVAAAAAHAGLHGLAVEYQCTSSDALVLKKKRFDIVLALEIVEHVTNRDAFISHCAALCKPGGLVVMSTLNRTAKSFVLGKVAAEYVLGWVPRGTHDWKKFVRPSELARSLRACGLTPNMTEGIVFDPLKGEFRRDPHDISVNYITAAKV